jgi:hypothetical protein
MGFANPDGSDFAKVRRFGSAAASSLDYSKIQQSPARRPEGHRYSTAAQIFIFATVNIQELVRWGISVR